MDTKIIRRKIHERERQNANASPKANTLRTGVLCVFDCSRARERGGVFYILHMYNLMQKTYANLVKSSTLTTLKYFCIDHGNQRVFSKALSASL